MLALRASVSILLIAASCATATPDDLGAFAAESVDAGASGEPEPGSPDADPGEPPPPADAAPPAALAAPHIVLSEVALAPTDGEFIEIYNGTDETVDLASVYLSDASEYYLLPGLTGAGPSPALSTYDFIARFPSGSSIGSSDAVTVAMDGDMFAATYGIEPDFCLRGATCIALEVIIGSTNSTLTNAGEPITLFEWGGSADLVADLDLVLTGEPTATNPMPSKSGAVVDGPDSGTAKSSYEHDSLAMSYYPSAPGASTSIKRHAPEQGEHQDFGNGKGGHDETSEDLTASWGAPPYSAPTPGTVPDTLLSP